MPTTPVGIPHEVISGGDILWRAAVRDAPAAYPVESVLLEPDPAIVPLRRAHDTFSSVYLPNDTQLSRAGGS